MKWMMAPETLKPKANTPCLTDSDMAAVASQQNPLDRAVDGGIGEPRGKGSALHRLREQLHRIFLAGHVAGHGNGLATQCSNTFGNRCGSGGVTVTDHHCGTSCDKKFRQLRGQCPRLRQ